MQRLLDMCQLRLSTYVVRNNQADGGLEENKKLLKEYERYENEYMDYLISSNDSIGTVCREINIKDEIGQIALTALELSVYCYVNNGIDQTIKAIDSEFDGTATVRLVAQLLFDDNIFENYYQITEAVKRLEKFINVMPGKGSILNAKLEPDERFMGFITYNNNPRLLSERYISLYGFESNEYEDEELQDAFFIDEIDSAVSEYMSYVDKYMGEFNPSGIEAPVIIFSGAEGSGRKFAIKYITSNLEMPLIMIDVKYLRGKEDNLLKWRKVLRELYFTNAAITITGVEKDLDTKTDILNIVREYRKVYSEIAQDDLLKNGLLRPLFITSKEEVKMASFMEAPFINMNIPLPKMDRAEIIWDYYRGLYPEAILPASSELSAKLKLNVGQIHNIVKRMSVVGDNDPNLVYKYSYELLDDGRFDGINRVTVTEKIDNIMLPAEQKRIMYDICDHVIHRNKVMKEWNLEDKYSYGTGTSALFVGPPGTGKTMAARIVAGMLGLELYQIDLSQVVDKYVGETEKKLNDIFHRAENSNMVLFFDEADALIGKRSEVKDAKDRYANVEIAFLLQRIEQYDGVVILASNFLQNIDSAFLRRIRFVVNFSMPTIEERIQIWKSLLPDAMPVGEIDYNYLAENFEFSGAQIKNVMFNAAFYAAGDIEQRLEMKHLVRALRTELLKDKKVSLAEVLGAYYYLI